MASRRADKAPPSFPLYYKDAYTDASFVALPWEAQGLFWRLACWQWDDGDIPADLNLVIAIVGKPKETKRTWPLMLQFFKPVPDQPDRLRNGRTHELREEMLEQRKKRQIGADKTNAQRWGTDSHSDSHSDRIATKERFASRVADADASTQEPDTSELGEGCGEGCEGLTQDLHAIAPPPPLDFAAVAPLVHKIQNAAFSYPPSDQICFAWIQEYGADLVHETLVDCEPQYGGKSYRYFEAILNGRRNNPNERPGNRRKQQPCRDAERDQPERKRKIINFA